MQNGNEYTGDEPRVIDRVANSGRRLVSVVVPVYDSPALEALAEGIGNAFQDRADAYEIIFVDDGSPDERIWPELERLARERKHVRAVQLTRNFGQQAATLCGLREASGDLIITIDDDLQHEPAEIPLLLARADHDIVIGQFGQKEHRLLRRSASRLKGLFDEMVIPNDLLDVLELAPGECGTIEGNARHACQAY